MTIKAYDRRSRSFLLDFPNNEVKAGFLALVAADYLKPSDSQTESWLANVSRSLYAGDVPSFRIGVNFSSKTGTVAEFEVDPPVD